MLNLCFCGWSLLQVRNLVYMVNKRERTRSLVYQMKEDIFRQEVTLAELEGEEESTAKQIPDTKFPLLPKFCHHSTGTVYDQPEDILRMAWLFEERGQQLDRKNLSTSLQKTSTPRHTKSRLASDISPSRSRRNRQNTRPSQADVDGIASSPVTSRSPIQQLFRDKMEGLESASWAMVVKTDSTSDEPSEANNETAVTLPVTTDKSDALTATDAASLTCTPSSNGLVKSLNAANDQKRSDSSAEDGNQENKFVVGEQMPLSNAGQNDAGAIVPEAKAAADLQETAADDINKTDHTTNDLQVITRHSDKVLTCRENNGNKMKTVDSENVETAKPKAARSGSRSADRKGRGTAKKDVLKESGAVTNDSDTVPQIKTRRRASKAQVNNVADELNSSLSPRSSVSRSTRKTRSSEHLGDSSDILSTPPAASKSDVNLKRPDLSSVSRSSSGKSRENKRVRAQGASASESDSGLRQEPSKDEQFEETASEVQKVPLQDSSALNQDISKEAVAELLGIRNSETTDSLTSNSLDSKTFNKPYFHADNFRLVEVESSKSTDDQNQLAMRLLEMKDEATELHGSSTAETTHTDDGALVSDTRVVDSDSTSEPKLTNSAEQKESANSSEMLSSETPPSKLENVRKSTSSVSRSRTKSRPAVHGVDATKVLQAVDWDNTSELKVADSAKQKESDSSLDGDHDALFSETLASKLESVKKPASSARRSRTKIRPGMQGIGARKELCDDTANDNVKEDGVKRKSANLLKRKTKKVRIDAVSVVEKSESCLIKPTDDAASPDKNLRLTLDSQEGPASDISTNKLLTEVPVSVSSESLVVSLATDNRLELTSSDVSDSLPFSVTDQASSDRTDVDNLTTGLKSSTNDSLALPRNLAPNLVKRDIGLDNLRRTKVGPFYSDSASRTSLSMKDGWKSGVNDVELGKTSTASSRKRAAHLMAGCRPRTVSVKRPPPTIEDTLFDEHRDSDHNKYDQLPTSEHLTFIQTDSDFDKSAGDKCSPLHTPKHMPFVRTNYDISQSAETLTESSNQFFRITPTDDGSAKYISQLNFSGTVDTNEEVFKSKLAPQNLPVKDNLWQVDTSHTYERPPLMRYDSGGNGFSGSLLGSPESKTLSSPPVVTDGRDSRRERLRAELLRKFLPSQLIVSDSVKRRVQEGLQLLSSMRSAPTICSHTRQKLADYLSRSRKEAASYERLPLRPIEDKREQSPASVRRRLPERPRYRMYSEWDYISGEEFTSPVSDAESKSDSDYSVDFEDLAESEGSVKSSRPLVRTREHRISPVHH